MKGYKWEQSSWNQDIFQDLLTNSDNICIETCCLACHCNSNNKQRRRYYDVKEYIDNVTKKNPHNSRNHNIFDTKSYSLVDLHQSKILKNIINDSNLIKNSGYTTNLKHFLQKQNLHQRKKYLKIYRCWTYAHIQTGQMIRFKKHNDF